MVTTTWQLSCRNMATVLSPVHATCLSMTTAMAAIYVYRITTKVMRGPKASCSRSITGDDQQQTEMGIMTRASELYFSMFGYPTALIYCHKTYTAHDEQHMDLRLQSQLYIKVATHIMCSTETADTCILIQHTMHVVSRKCDCIQGQLKAPLCACSDSVASYICLA